MKKLILDVNSNGCCADTPDFLIVELSEAGVNRIKELAAYIKQKDLLTAGYLDSSGTYFTYSTLSQALESTSLTQLTEEQVASMDDGLLDLELRQIVVSEDDFCFQAIPKHYDAWDSITTVSVPLSTLDSADFINLTCHSD